jgi:hypothetical protein
VGGEAVKDINSVFEELNLDVVDQGIYPSMYRARMY